VADAAATDYSTAAFGARTIPVLHGWSGWIRRPREFCIRSLMVGPAAAIELACCYLQTYRTNHTDPWCLLSS
jgi:hypothetical protein